MKAEQFQVKVIAIVWPDISSYGNSLFVIFFVFFFVISEYITVTGIPKLTPQQVNYPVVSIPQPPCVGGGAEYLSFANFNHSSAKGYVLKLKA